MNVSTQRFWIIWGPAGTTNPRKRFLLRLEAHRVAAAMTEKHGCQFHVMEVVETCDPPPKPGVRWTTYARPEFANGGRVRPPFEFIDSTDMFEPF